VFLAEEGQSWPFLNRVLQARILPPRPARIEAHADLLVQGVAGRTGRQRSPEQPGDLPVVDPDATVLEIAAVMTRVRSPLVAVVDDEGRMRGAITLHALLDRVLAS